MQKKLTREDVQCIFVSPFLAGEVAQEYGIAETTVRQIWCRNLHPKWTDHLCRESRIKRVYHHPPEVIAKVLEAFTSDDPCPVVAERLGVRLQWVDQVRTRATFRSVTESLPQPKYRSQHGVGALTDDQVRAIYVAEGTLLEVGERFGVTDDTVAAIRKGCRSDITSGLPRGEPRRRMTRDMVRAAFVDPRNAKEVAKELGTSIQWVLSIRSRKHRRAATDDLPDVDRKWQTAKRRRIG